MVMKYDLNKLNPTDFEDFIQSLSKRLLGNGSISFGEGTDGGREAEFNGSAPFPSTTNSWDGYWVIQAKFKSITVADEAKDFNWVKNQLSNELQKYKTRKIKVKRPDNYLLFTNVVLTAKPVTGGRDKANKLQEEYEKLYGINHIRIISYDDISNYLDANRDLAISYSPFILPGDVLSKLLTLLKVKEDRSLRTKEIIIRFLEGEFLEDMQAKLDHAGKLTSDKVNLENVFIDLYATADGQYIDEIKDEKFVKSILEKGNTIIKGKEHANNRFVLIAGPGYGKSTLTQFIMQTYRAFFIDDTDITNRKLEAASTFISNFLLDRETPPKWIRLPIKIILKEYAGWISERNQQQQSIGTSVIEYIVYNINRKSSGGDLTVEELEDLLHNIPSIFVFDGLDEVPPSSNRATVLSEISFFTETILRRIDADTIILATTRPQGYSKEFDNSRFKHLYITDLQQSDCKIYLNRLLIKVIDDLDERQRKFKILSEALLNDDIARLMKSPLQASIMAILVKSGGNPPRNKFDLFANYYDIIFKREKQRGISMILNDRPEYVQEIHNRLGFYLQAVSERQTNPSATVTKFDFIKLVNNYLEEVGLDTEEIDRISEAIVIAATDRLVFISEIQDQRYGFAIRSLQEYFAAHGYLHNVHDEIIRARLNSICGSSYWGNTLLFAIGFIAKNKIYLSDFIESICHELNGSSDEKDRMSLNSIVKTGSWLALDIVNEGIFNGNPKIENKFCNLLGPLFHLSRNDKHKEIRRLPSRVIEKWVKKFLNEAISQSSVSLATLEICALLEVAGYNTMDLVKDHWPSDSVREAYFINNLIRFGMESDFLVEKFIDKIQLKKEDYLTLFTSEDSYNFIETACKHHSNTDQSRKVLLELIFIVSLSQDETLSTISLFELFGIEFSEETSDFSKVLYSKSNALKIEIIDGYSYQILKTKIQNDGILAMHKFATEKKASLVSAICQFLIDPVSDNFIHLNELIESLSEKYRKFVVNHLRTLNSFFASAYRDNGLSKTWKTSLNEIEGLELNSFESEDLKFEFRKYLRSSSLSKKNEIVMIDEYINTYLQLGVSSSTPALVNFFRLVDWTISKLEKEKVEILTQEATRFKLIESAIREYSDNEGLNFRNLYTMFFFLSIDECHQIVSKSEKILNFNLVILDKEQAQFGYNDFNYQFTFAKLIDLINLQIIKNDAPSYKLLLQHCLTGLVLYNEIDYKSIPISSIRREQSGGKYKAIILLLSRSFSEDDYDKFVSFLNEDQMVFFDRSFINVLLYVLRFAGPSNTIEKVFIFLKTRIDDEEYESELETQIKNYLGSQPTNVQIPEKPTY